MYQSIIQSHFPCRRLDQVDVDNAKIAKTVAESGITQMPTFMFMRGLNIVAQFSGADKDSLESNGMTRCLFSD
jgi:hypothetical protein